MPTGLMNRIVHLFMFCRKLLVMSVHLDAFNALPYPDTVPYQNALPYQDAAPHCDTLLYHHIVPHHY